jgi:hypothetical protein
MARTFVSDSGGVSRLVTRMFVVDSGAISRQVKRQFIVDSGGVSRLVFVAAQVIATSVNGSTTSPATAEAIIAFTTAGQEIQTSNEYPGGSVVGNWLPGGNTGLYQIKATLSSGTAPNYPGATNTLNVWLPVTSDLDWGLQLTANGSESCSLLFQVSTNSSEVIASGTVHLSVSRVPGGG